LALGLVLLALGPVLLAPGLVLLAPGLALALLELGLIVGLRLLQSLLFAIYWFTHSD